MNEQQKAALAKLCNAIATAISGGILHGADIPQLLKDCQELEIDPEDIRETLRQWL